MSKGIKSDGASVVIMLEGVEAADSVEAIKTTESALLLCRDIIALRQKQRGNIAGFLVMQTDVTPPKLFSKVRRPYPVLHKVMNLPIGESEQDIFIRVLQKADATPQLAVYLSLYADTLSYSDTLVTDLSLETRLLKTWAFLEAMAISEPGNKKQKVKSLFQRYQLSLYENYHNHPNKDLLDIAYNWRNVIAHSGGCKTAVKPADIQFCQDFKFDFNAILDDLSECCRSLLHMYANSLPQENSVAGY